MACMAANITAALYAQENTQESISAFEEKWTISAFAHYRMGIFNHNDTEYYVSDRYITNNPLALGLGLRYKKIAASFSYPLPIKNKTFSMDFDFNSYLQKMYFEGYFKYYGDFYTEETNQKSGLDVLSLGVMATYVLNHENHSLSSVINLDKKQNTSSGSFLLSAGTFYSSLYSSNEIMSNYSERQRLLYTGPGFGYSYIHVFNNGMFFNISLLVFANIGINTTAVKMVTIPQLEPRFVFGQHKNRWSFNIKLVNNSAIIIWDNLDGDVLDLLKISTMFSVRL